MNEAAWWATFLAGFSVGVSTLFVVSLIGRVLGGKLK